MRDDLPDQRSDVIDQMIEGISLEMEKLPVDEAPPYRLRAPPQFRQESSRTSTTRISASGTSSVVLGRQLHTKQEAQQHREQAESEMEHCRRVIDKAVEVLCETNARLRALREEYPDSHNE